jgi:quinol monooxygenase YgiN
VALHWPLDTQGEFDMKVIIAGSIDLEDPAQVKEMLLAARPHIEGALTEEGCLAYDWTEDHLVPGRVHVYEEWTSSDALEAHLNDHWYRDMGAHLAKYPRKPSTNVIRKFRIDLEEPVYDSNWVARGHFSTAKSTGK